MSSLHDWNWQHYGISAGLVVVGLIAIYVIWKVTKSAFKLFFWLALMAGLLAAATWLLNKAGIIHP